MDTIAISDLRANLPSLIDRVSEKLERLIVTVSGKPRAVVMSLEELESLEETAEILALPGALKAIQKGIAEAKNGKGILLSELK